MEDLFEVNVSNIKNGISIFPSFETEKWNSFSKPAGTIDKMSYADTVIGSLNPAIENWN